MHPDNDNACVAHLQTGENAQNQRESSSRITIPQYVQFRRVLCVVSMTKELTNCKNCIFQKPFSIVRHPDTENASVPHLQTGENAQNQRKFASAIIANRYPVQFRRILCVVSRGKDLLDCQNWHLSQTI